DIFGSRGVLTLEENREHTNLTLTECGVTIPERLESGSVLATWKKEPRVIPIPPGQALEREIDAFIGAVVNGRAVPTDGNEGLRVVEALSMVAPKQRVPFQYLDE